MRKAILVALLVPLALAAAACGGGGGSSSGTSGGGASQPLRATVTTAEGAPLMADLTVRGGKKLAAGRSSSSGATAVPQIGPKIVQTASLELSVKRGRFGETVDDARTLVAGLGGFVASSSASQGRGGRLVRGTLVLRVPARAYARAMSALANMGHIDARRESGQDVSAEFVDLQARERQLRAVEVQLLALLGKARNVSEALAVQNQLDETQLELEQVRGRLDYLDNQVAYATIALAVHERAPIVTPSQHHGWGVVHVWSVAAHGFVRVLEFVVVAVATAAPVLILIVLGWFGVRVVRRRRVTAQ
ncbi:MAG: DUF4349 domain-containing protein [Actinobacteria bacterium]|nr:MAG: DUF4349 domain-containing protein [Actinomycetota bacterium]